MGGVALAGRWRIITPRPPCLRRHDHAARTRRAPGRLVRPWCVGHHAVRGPFLYLKGFTPSWCFFDRTALRDRPSLPATASSSSVPSSATSSAVQPPGHLLRKNRPCLFATAFRLIATRCSFESRTHAAGAAEPAGRFAHRRPRQVAAGRAARRGPRRRRDGTAGAVPDGVVEPPRLSQGRLAADQPDAGTARLLRGAHLRAH